jgi:hypothetical protein
MKKLYNISRVIISVITFIIFNIMFINEDISWRIIPPILAVIVFLISYPSVKISQFLIKIGNKIENKLMKILYYAGALTIVSFSLCYGIYFLVISIFEYIPTPNEFEPALGQALLCLFLTILGIICIIIPYVQTLIVLILKQFIRQ